jgi:hypothetical protein
MKKRTFLLIATIGLVVFAQAQTFQSFRINLGAGTSLTPGNSGLLVSAQPSFAINDNIAVGLKFDHKFFNGMKWVNSEQLSGDYYITKNYGFRPYAGAAIGYYAIGLSGGGCGAGPSVATSSTSSMSDHANKIGWLLRTGFEARHFRFSVEYDFVPAKYVSYTETENGSSTTMEETYKNNYFGVTFGIVVGGVKKEKKK